MKHLSSSCKMDLFRDSFLCLPSEACNAASGSQATEYLVEGGKSCVWQFQESAAEIIIIKKS